MSTLLKKKYLLDRYRRLKTNEQPTTSSKDANNMINAIESLPTTGSSGCKRKLSLGNTLDSTLPAETVSVVCVTMSNCRRGKGVAFAETIATKILPAAQSSLYPPLDAEALQQHRDDIWYSVGRRSVFVSLLVMDVCMSFHLNVRLETCMRYTRTRIEDHGIVKTKQGGLDLPLVVLRPIIQQKQGRDDQTLTEAPQ